MPGAEYFCLRGVKMNLRPIRFKAVLLSILSIVMLASPSWMSPALAAFQETPEEASAAEAQAPADAVAASDETGETTPPGAAQDASVDAGAAGEPEAADGAEVASADGEEQTAGQVQEDPLDAQGDWGRFQPIADLVDAGGPIIVILGLLSVISLAIIIVKLTQFTILRVGDHKFVEKLSLLLQDGDRQEALDILTKRRGVIARVMETALRGRILSSDEQHVREEVERVARAKLDGMERGLPLLSLIATISPLLGLLGTVLGMIEAFQQLENAGDRVDPAILSGGIWEALLTTAAGLSVAIPAAAFFTWLQRSVEVAAQHMEDAATRVFTAVLYEEASAGAEDDADSADKAAA